MALKRKNGQQRNEAGRLNEGRKLMRRPEMGKGENEEFRKAKSSIRRKYVVRN